MQQPKAANSLPTVYAKDTQIAARYSVSRPTIWRWVTEGKLPHPIRLSPGCTRWRLSDLEAFEQGLEAAR